MKMANRRMRSRILVTASIIAILVAIGIYQVKLLQDRENTSSTIENVSLPLGAAKADGASVDEFINGIEI